VNTLLNTMTEHGCPADLVEHLSTTVRRAKAGSSGG